MLTNEDPVGSYHDPNLQARSSLYADTQLRTHARQKKRTQSKRPAYACPCQIKMFKTP